FVRGSGLCLFLIADGNFGGLSSLGACRSAAFRVRLRPARFRLATARLLGRVAGILRLLLLALDEIGAVISADIRRRAGGGSVGGLGLRFRLRGLIGRRLGCVRVPFGLLVGRLLVPLGALD